MGYFVGRLLMVFVFQSKTGALEGPEVDGFVKDMMELVRVSHSFSSMFDELMSIQFWLKSGWSLLLII